MDNRGCSPTFLTVSLIIGFIASIIGIYAFFSGNETMNDAVASFSENDSSTLISKIPPKNTFLPLIVDEGTSNNTTNPLESSKPLITGSAKFTIEDLYTHHRVGYNFKEGKYSSDDVPADISFDYCYHSYEGPRCDLIGTSKIAYFGKIPLDEVLDIPQDTYFSTQFYCSDECKIDTGYTYALLTFDGHPAKFRTSNMEYIRDDEDDVVGFVFTINWVYQPNERKDFQGQ